MYTPSAPYTGKPHALTAVSNAPDYISAGNLTVTYTDLKKIKTLTEGNKTYTLTYGVDDQRRKSVFTQGAATTARYYVGDYEEVHKSDGTIQKIHYLRGGSMMLQQGSTHSLYYGYHDYQGSLIAWTNQSGAVVERRAYDPWGRHRDPTRWTEVDYASTSWLNNRGYTGHEHLDAFQIINMNGRVYDPLTAQFFSPDPYIQAPDNWLNYNRYGYCLNNPLIYTDPDGEFWHIVFGAAIGGVINLVTNWDNCAGFWEYAAAFGAGAGSGALTAAFGPLGALGGGALVGGINDIISQTKNNFSGPVPVNWGQVGISTGVGGLAGIAGYGAGQWASSSLGGVVINGFGINSQSVWAHTINSAIGGAIGGYAGGFTGSFLMTGDRMMAHQSGMQGLKFGAGIGAGTGFAGGLFSAQRDGLNPWTGKPKNSVVIGRQMESRVNPAANDLGAETITKPWNEHFGEGVMVSDSKGIQFNREWYSVKLNKGYTVYDIGTGGLPNGKYYGTELSLSKGYWNIVKTNYWSYLNNNIRIIYYGR